MPPAKENAGVARRSSAPKRRATLLRFILRKASVLTAEKIFVLRAELFSADAL